MASQWLALDPNVRHTYAMAITIIMDRAGRLVVPRAVRERFGLTGGESHEMELVEAPDGIVLRPVGADVPVTRDASGWVVFHSDTDGVATESIDPVAVVEAERERRTRQVTGE
jgi:AbrB family looped-hinge helix DNA binding protein